MARKVINSPDYYVPVKSFSQVIKAPPNGQLIFLSGITSRRGPEGTLVGEGDIEAQTRQVLENIKMLLEAAGATMEDVVHAVTYVRNADDIPQISAIRLEYFGDPPPTTTTVEVSRLFDTRQLLEIDVTAVIPVEAA